MRDSGALLLAFLAAGMVDSAIVQSMCYKMYFNLNTVYAYAPYACMVHVLLTCAHAI